MKKFILVLAIVLVAMSLAFGQMTSYTFPGGQQVPIQTSLTYAITGNGNLQTATTIYLTSVTGMNVGGFIYIDLEAMQVVGVNSATTPYSVTVRRAQFGTMAAPHNTTATVLYGQQSVFQTVDMQGSCVASATIAQPVINVRTGAQFLCSSVVNSWVPGWNNNLYPAQPTAAVASAAGLVTPSGPLFHITGALAITGFNIPLGFSKGGFCVIADGAYTTTTANNIAYASTAVTGKQMCFAYDPATAKFYPSY